MLDLLEHTPLIVRVFHLFHLDNLRFFEDLDSVKSLVVLRLDQVHTAEAAGTQGALDGEVVESVLALGDAHRGLLGGGLLGAAIGGLRTGVVGRVYQILYAGHVVGGLLIGLGRRLRGSVGLLRVRGIHRVGGLVGRRGRRALRGGLRLVVGRGLADDGAAGRLGGGGGDG